MQCICTTLTSQFVVSITRRVRFGPEPPPPKKAQVRATVRARPDATIIHGCLMAAQTPWS